MSRIRSTVVLIAASLAIVAFVWTAAIWLGGGMTMTIGGLRLSSYNVWRPLAIGVGATIVVIALGGLPSTIATLRRRATRITPQWAAGVLAIATAVAGLGLGSWTASGPDSFAYVSQAALWRTGQLEVPLPLATKVPWPNAVETFVPFGYRAAPDGKPAVVPVTAPGLPLLMAGLQTIGGHAAAFVVTPLAAAALVLFTFALGRETASPRVGLIGAWLVATSPAVLFMLMWPMTDIVAAASTAVMIWLLAGHSNARAFGAGLAAAAGMTIRPNFAVIAAGAFAWLMLDGMLWRARSGLWSRTLAFAAGLAPGVAFVAAVNARWYGSPFASGYGNAGGMLSVSHLLTNAARYGRWLIETSPVGLIGLLAIAFPAATLWSDAGSRRVSSLFAIVIAAACSVYLLYGEFDEWWYLRFLLPAWPPMFIATAVVLDRVSRHSAHLRMAAAGVVVAIGVAGIVEARSRGVFIIGEGERRYATIAHLVESATEPGAVIFTCQHVGTVLYYGGRTTLRFDQLDPAWLDRAVEWLATEGRHPYFLVEDWEHPQFETRFASSNQLGRLSFSPALAWESSHTKGVIYLYDPIRRDARTVRPRFDVESREPFSSTPRDFPPSP